MTAMAAPPEIVVRPGPTGPRAGVAGGPDVWEIVRDVQGAECAGAADPVAAVCATSGLERAKVEAGLSYYADHRDEVDARIRVNKEATQALRGWEARRTGEVDGLLP
jgi:hypothetical protein